jgi:hypothetical protein
MEERREKQKAVVFDLEAAAAFADSALAQNDDLVAATKRVHDHGPFLEGNAHD